MDDRLGNQKSGTEWLSELLEEVGLQQFYPKLTNDLQLTKLSHFDFVSENDLIELGISRPASKRLLAAIRKRKSFVTALKNKIVNKLIPLSTSQAPFSSHNSTSRETSNKLSNTSYPLSNGASPEIGRLTCLINSQDVQIKEEIGHGVHGFVKKGEWTAPNGRVVEVALKILRKDVMAEPGASFNDFVKEISVMHQLNHPNIIKLYGIVLSSPMMMVTELAPFGNLKDKLKKENGSTPISQLINFGVQIASGMEYLESKRFVHRDLAARNIFISHGKKILIGDLGLMRVIPTQEDHYVMSEKTKIPYPWCAPESLRYKQFSSASDVYMFGVTMWEMFSFGKEPWAGLNLNEIMDNISSQKRRLPCPEACPIMVYQTLLQCWNTEPTCRPNFSTLYQYLSTSYPLEVRSTQSISEIGQKRHQNGNLLPDDLNSSPSSSSSFEQSEPEVQSSFRKVLSCNVDDRILVIDGQPEKYWWKGQNQRTFEIGWFPLCSTRWLAPKRNSHYISKPLKNSFVHTGHCGVDGKWGNPRFIDRMYLKNPLEPEDFNMMKAARSPLQPGEFRHMPKPKSKSRLSRLFGISNTTSVNSTTDLLLPHCYTRFSNERKQSDPRQGKASEASESPFTRSQSDEIAQLESATPDEGPLLIDFSDDGGQLCAGDRLLSGLAARDQQESLIDMEDPIPRPSSDTRLNRSDDPADNYRLSWAGSWNTGTFDGSESNIYSAYYCPVDEATAAAAAAAASLPVTAGLATSKTFELAGSAAASRYYSAVCEENNSIINPK